MPTKIKHDKGTVTVSDTLDKMVRLVLNNFAPNIEKIIKTEMGQIMQHAEDNWLVRSYTTTKGTSISKKSQDSKSKFQTETLIVSKNGGLGIRGVIRNTAPYAYVIKKGKNSIISLGKNSELPEGSHLWTELVKNPLLERAEEINNQVITELANIQKRA